MSKATFAPGDVVQLKSGGPAMTVSELDKSMAMCIWFRPEGKPEHHAFPVSVLTPFSPTPDDSTAVDELQRRVSDHI